MCSCDPTTVEPASRRDISASHPLAKKLGPFRILGQCQVGDAAPQFEVDDGLRTDSPEMYAAGDVAETAGRLTGERHGLRWKSKDCGLVGDRAALTVLPAVHAANQDSCAAPSSHLCSRPRSQNDYGPGSTVISGDSSVISIAAYPVTHCRTRRRSPASQSTNGEKSKAKVPSPAARASRW